MLFKGRFQLEVKSTIKSLFKNNSFSLKEKLDYVKDSDGNADIYKFIQNNCFSFHLYETLNIYKFNFHKPIGLNPEKWATIDKDFNISFVVRSGEISILKIIGDRITFKNSDNEEHTVSLPKDIEIVKV